MRAIEIGSKGEKKAIRILRVRGFKEIKHLAGRNHLSFFDIRCLKNNKEYFVEVKSSSLARYSYPSKIFKTSKVKEKGLNFIVILINRKDKYSVLEYDLEREDFKLLGYKGFPILHIGFDKHNEKKKRPFYHCPNCRSFFVERIENKEIGKCLCCGKYFTYYFAEDTLEYLEKKLAEEKKT